jgi:tRNA G10  N-methylase Trm11
MWVLANAKPHSMVCDIGCGSGTIISECLRSLSVPVAGFGIGGEISPDSASMASLNLAQIGCSAATDVAVWDMMRIPLRDASQDVCLCDLPFGKQHSKQNKLTELYSKAAREISRVLVVGGRAVLMGVCKRLGPTLVKHLPLEIKFQARVEKGGILIAVVVLEKVASQRLT